MSEVLAPCGSIQSLTAALNSGADAVYVGLKAFSARRNAENFSAEELKYAAAECHKRGVKLYVTLNTLIYDKEQEEFAACVKTAAVCGADGIILQDIGGMAIAKAVCPELPRHASTQMTLNSVSGVKAAEKLGYSRVVIGRELSRDEIAYIRANTTAELEVFVHGALCVCVSGQCYMSSLFGGRSGNRGLCAQPCRLDFTYNDCHNVLSLKDMSLVKYLREPELADISSLKIEGRMKRPEYVACATNACKQSLAGEPYDLFRLRGIFSRGGLTDGYFLGNMEDMNGIRGKDDVESSAFALKGIKELYKDEYPRFPVNINIVIKRGETVKINIGCGIGADISMSMETEVVPEDADERPLDGQSVCERLSKFGGTPFYAENVTAEIDEGLYLSAAALNAFRRQVCGALEKTILERNTPKYIIRDYAPIKNGSPREEDSINFRAEVTNGEQLQQALRLDFDLVYAPMDLLSESTPNKKKIAVIPPMILNGCEEEVEAQLTELRDMGFNKGLAHTLSHAELLKKCEYNILGGYRMNVLNSAAVKACSEFGFWDITLSFEGAAAELEKISSGRPLGIVAYGRLPLMLLRRCPLVPAAQSAENGDEQKKLTGGRPCGRRSARCGETMGCIKDRHGNDIRVLCGGNSVELLNPDVLILSDKPELLRKFDFAVLKFTDETDVGAVLKMYRSRAKADGKYTRGLYFRGAE